MNSLDKMKHFYAGDNEFEDMQFIFFEVKKGDDLF